jgi:hypothetical protein
VNQRKITESTKKELTETTLKLSEATSTGNRLRSTMDTDQRLLKDISSVVRNRLGDTAGMGLLDVVRRLVSENKDMWDQINTGNVTSEEVNRILRSAFPADTYRELKVLAQKLVNEHHAVKMAKLTASYEADLESNLRVKITNIERRAETSERLSRKAQAVLQRLREALGAKEGEDLGALARHLREHSERLQRENEGLRNRPAAPGFISIAEYDKLNQRLVMRLDDAEEMIIEKNEHIDVLNDRIAKVKEASENSIDVATKIHLASNRAHIAARRAIS